MSNETVTPYINRISRSCCMPTVSVLIIAGNTICLIVLRKTKSLGMKDTTKIFMISLSCADLGLGIFGAIPISITAALGKFPIFPSSPVPFCFYQAVICCVLSFASCGSLLAITTERYISVVHPLRYPVTVTVRRSKITASLLWGIQFLLVVVHVILLQPRFYGRDAKVEPDYLLCFPSVVRHIKQQALGKGSTNAYPFFIIIAAFIFIPTLTILFMYTRMLFISRQRLSGFKLESKSDGVTVTIAKQRTASERRAAITFLIITTASIMAWLPFTAVTFKEFLLQQVVESHWKFLSILFLFSGSLFNVVVYYIRNERFRLTARHLIYSFSRLNLQSKYARSLLLRAKPVNQ